MKTPKTEIVIVIDHFIIKYLLRPQLVTEVTNFYTVLKYSIKSMFFKGVPIIDKQLQL